MILADTSVWVDHLRNGNADLTRHLNSSEIIIHDFIIGEIALGSLRNRPEILSLLNHLPKTSVAMHSEVMAMIDRQMLYSKGIGYVDAHLIASCLLGPHITLWTFDRRLKMTAENFSLATL